MRRPVVTRRAPDGTPTSSSTQPSLMATMLARLVRQLHAWAADRDAVPWLETWPGDWWPDRPVTGLRVIPKPRAHLILGY